MATLNSNTLVDSPTSHNEIQSTAEVENIVRHLDFAALDRLMNAAAAISNNQVSLKSIWQKNIKSKIMTNNSLSESSENIRKSSRGSEEDPRSFLSDEEEEEFLEEDILNEDQCSAFLATSSSDLIDNKNSSKSNTMSKSIAKNLSAKNFSQTDSINEEVSEEEDDLIFNNKPMKSPGRRKSSSRLARQTGGGNNGAVSKYTCHLCSFNCDDKPQFNAHMDKHYEHRCSRCGYGCRTKGRLNRHIREAHPDLASELNESKSKRKKRPASIDLNLISSNPPKIKHDTEDVLSNSVELSDAGSDSTIIIDQNKANNVKTPEARNSSQNSSVRTKNPVEPLENNSMTITFNTTNDSLANIPSSPETELSYTEELDQSNSCNQPPSPSNSEQISGSGIVQTNITRQRRYNCKQCRYVSTSKADSWKHNKTHIKLEKRLKCPNCTFVTEYKHHLEYHLRLHFNSKPYKCIKCNYSCINKSMLSSHLKSHSNVYQFRCNDCAYATKYCHSLKLHLRKYSHKPDKVLNLDGSENPYPIIDVYGTRRGPRPKKGVGSIKLVKQVLEDNNHVTVDKEKVELIVTTLSEQNPEEGDEKLFRLMRSSEEKEVRVDQQLNYIIGEQLKANAGTTLPNNSAIDCQNHSSTDKNECKEVILKDSLSQIKSQNNCKALSKPFTSNQIQSTVHFVKEKIKLSQNKIMKKSDSDIKDSNQTSYFQNLSSNTDLDDQEKVQSPTLKQSSNQKLLNLINSEQISDIPTALLARSLLSPSVFSSNEKEANSLFMENYTPNQAQQLINNHLLENQLALIAQFKANQQIVNNMDSKQESTDFLNSLSNPNSIFSQLATLNMVLNNNKFTDSSHLQEINNLWTESNLNTIYEQQSNPIMNSNFLNRALLNFSPRSQTSSSVAALTNNSSSPDALTNHILDETSNGNSKSLTNSMITNWHSYAASLLNNSKFQATSLLSTPSSPPDNQMSILNVGTTNSLTKSKTTDQLDMKNVTNTKQPQSSLQQKAILSSQNDLGSVLNSIGQVFSSSPNLCPTSNTNNQSSELDLSTILGYSMLAMRMQQQYGINSPSQQKKIKESF